MVRVRKGVKAHSAFCVHVQRIPKTALLACLRSHPEADVSSPAWVSFLPLETTPTTAWDNIVNGRSGIGRIIRFDPHITTHIAGEVKDFDISTYISS